MIAQLKPLLLFLLLSGVSARLLAQSLPPQYLEEALANNRVLKEKKIALDKSLLALKEAKSLFLPSTSFEAQYTLAKGGRSINIPVGDLVNPVYATLNQLTGSNNFKPISNVSEQLNPDNFYDLRIKTTLSLINPALQANRNIQEQQAALQANEADTYKRELVKEVKNAYFNYLAAGKATAIYESALGLVQQNLRVNQSLLSNGKGLPAYVSRAESEVKLVESQLLTAQNDQRNAGAYFNFLLNRPLTDSVIISHPDFKEALLQLNASLTGDISNREELKGLSIAKTISRQALKLNQAYRIPRLNAFLDLAAQGFDFRMNRKSFFYLGGIQLQVPLFYGKRNLYKIGQSQLDLTALQLHTDQVKEQLQLAAFVSRNNVLTAYGNYQSAVKQEEAAQKYFNLTDKGYKEGISPFIELLDARTQLTNARLLVNISESRVWQALADYERQTATFILP